MPKSVKINFDNVANALVDGFERLILKLEATEKEMGNVLSDKLDNFGIPLVEMARIGDYKSYSFWVYHEPLKNPSFHIQYAKDFDIAVQIKDLKIIEVKFNNTHLDLKKDYCPPGSIIKVIQEFFAEKSTDDPTHTNKEMIDILWRILNK